MRYFIGIDFGATTTSVSYTTDKSTIGPELIEFDGKKTINTAVRLTPDGTAVELIGNEAWEYYHEEPRRTFVEFKMDIGRGISYAGHGFTTTPEAVGVLFLRFLRERIERQFGNTPLSEMDVRDGVTTVIGYPAEWSRSQKDTVLSMAEKAGFPNVEGGAEPVGAIYYHALNGEIDLEIKNKVFVYDFGGGTSDTALVAMSNSCPPHVYCFDGLTEVGGRDYDRAIIENVIKPQLECTKYSPADLAEFQRKAQALKERLSNRIQDGFNEAEVHLGGLSCRSGSSAEISLTKGRFEEIASPLTGLFLEPVAATIKASRIPDTSIDYVIATGGSARLYFVDGLLRKAFPGAHYLRSNNPQEVIAKGLALFASRADKATRTATLQAEDDVVPDVEIDSSAKAPPKATNRDGDSPLSDKLDPYSRKHLRRSVKIAVLIVIALIALFAGRVFMSPQTVVDAVPAEVARAISLPAIQDATIKEWSDGMAVMVVWGWARNDTWNLKKDDIRSIKVHSINEKDDGVHEAFVDVTAVAEKESGDIGVGVTLVFYYTRARSEPPELIKADYVPSSVKKIGDWKWHQP